ncbi:uncharacterized protein SPPG_03264 [Spizellomyces punctatus DAOM BR117]|uniref:F-box domain-containing protein n=1 Tax=Spizellomyces punctatus (strain DAOM BR117) TaxID=645134 RepID=A0A0L0HK21_SPIPD|nr:uncharacterized protein SPPG_03264 [Spizellomyces punctatus DAOM BR117]KND01462.1 hypothetical protein SPPG_03264 [Spizellomyces punctatus DAOM BR117]|eukprot:XP_016609501.1 hypothetical protein SPPG_03264 [Spizellomyces punctatus DAOM BR117]
MNNPTVSSDTLLQAAVAAFKRSEYEKAIRLLTKGILQDQSNSKLYDCRALAFLNSGRFDDALSDAERLVKLDPVNPKGYIHAGKAFQLLGKTDSALCIYRIARKKVSKSHPRYSSIEKSYTELLEYTGNVKNSRTSISTIPLAVRSAPQTSLSNCAEGDKLISVAKRAKQDFPAATAAETLLSSNAAASNWTGNFGSYALPLELMTAIFHYLPMPTLNRCAQVSRNWRASVNGNSLLWTDVDLTPYSRKVSNTVVHAIVCRSGRLLRKLIVPGCTNITNTGLKSLLAQRCTSLTTFELTNNSKVTGQALAETMKSIGSQLTRLRLANTKVNDISIRSILDSCRALSDLDLSECPGVTDAAFEISLNFKKRGIPMALQKLQLSSCAVSDRTTFLLSQSCPSLREVNVSQCSRITKSTLVNMAHCSGIESLVLTGTAMNEPAAISFEDALLAFAEGCNQLRQFVLASCPRVSDTSVEYLAGFCTHLYEIDFTQCATITDSALRSLATHCPALSRVLIATCPRITDMGIIFLAQNAKELHHLDVSNNQSISDRSLEALTQHGTQLVTLAMNGCPKVTGIGIRAIVTSKPGKQLETLLIDNCPGVHYETLGILRKMAPNLNMSARFH